MISFHADECYGECPIFTMSIMEDGTATYHAERFNKQHGDFKTIIKQAQLDSLFTLIKNADIISLNDKYSTDVTDSPTYSLQVQFNSGLQKSIVDYGPSGPAELDKIYEFIFSLRETQDWR